MPEITRYTRQQTGIGQYGVQASPADMGAAIGQAAQGFGQELQAVSQRVQQVEQQRQSRLDTINRARTMDIFEQEAFEEFNRVQSEEDIIDENVSINFSKKIRDRAKEVLNGFEGSEDTKAQLYESLLGVASSYSMQLRQNSVAAQRSYVMDKAGEDLNDLVGKVRNREITIEDAYKELNGTEQIEGLMDRWGSAMYSEDELNFREAANGALAKSLLDSFLDSGQYEDAKDLINENPFVFNKITPKEQEAIIKEIDGALKEQDAYFKELNNKTNAYTAMAEKLGVEVSPTDIYAAATNINPKASPEDNVDNFVSLMQKRDPSFNAKDIPVETYAKIGMGIDIDLDSISDDDIKRYADFIKKPVEKASETKIVTNKVIQQADLFLETGNRQAALASVQSFIKMIDDGAVVRQSDLDLAASAQSWKERLVLFEKSLNKGEVVTEEQLIEMKEAANTIAQGTLGIYKDTVDPYMVKLRESGTNPMEIGLPQQKYDNLFNGISTKTDQKAAAISKVEGIAKQKGLSVDELVKKTAANRGVSEDKVRKDLGINGD